MKNVKKNSAKPSLENFNANKKLDKKQMNSVFGGQTAQGQNIIVAEEMKF